MCYDPAGQDRFNLGPDEKLKLPLVASLAGDGEHALNVGAVRRLLERRISEEGPNGRETEIPRSNRGASARLKVLQECADERRVEIPKRQLRREFAKAYLRECKQEPEGIAIGGDGVGAYASMPHEPIDEPPLDQHGQIMRGTHERTSHRSSNRRAT
jgi:hypothetical protein